MNTTNQKSPELIRGLGPWAAAAIVVGTMVGTGIFIKPGSMAQAAGTVGLVTLAWIIGGVLSLLGALSAAELGAAIPEAGGTYAYMNRAYGPVWGFVFGWTYSIIGAPTSIATIAAGLLQFASFLFPMIATPLHVFHFNSLFTHAPSTFAFTWAQPLAVVAIALITFVNYFGVRLGGRVQVVLTIIKIAAVVAIIFIGFLFGKGTVANFRSASAVSSMGHLGLTAGLMTAVASALWAYDGWINLTFVGSEIKNPERNIPLSLIAGVMAVAAIFIAMSVACFYVLPFSQAAASPHIASDVVARATGASSATWLTIIMMICALGTLNSSILTNARVDYAMARDGLFFRVVRGVHPRFRTPANALVFQGILASALALSGTFDDLSYLYVFLVWIFYAAQTAGLIVLRYKEPNMPRPYKTWGYPVLPFLFILGALALTVNSLMQRPGRSLMGIVVMLIGLIFYARWRKRAATEQVR
ncbi:MAG TPA: amino acid permease [Candidatus Acidoferrales bacterium]|nr:amino acid permease [Candidatus Acidoferrales bacterium]